MMSNDIHVMLYQIFHLNDDYCVRATKCDDIRVNIHSYSTPWLIKAIFKYIYFHIKYPDCTIVFTHYRYR